ncbi:hypothetical protein ABE66_21040 [Cytobacillus firmus]|nr:hypothetical protein [Cytobacillus firmus]
MCPVFLRLISQGLFLYIYYCRVDWSGRCGILKNAFTFSWCGVYSRKLIQSPAGAAGQVSTRRRAALSLLERKSTDNIVGVKYNILYEKSLF